MNRECVPFQVTQLTASVPQGVPIEWQGRNFSSGPLNVTLDEGGCSQGVLNYETRKAEAEFRVKLDFPEFADLLEGLGFDRFLASPVYAVLRSQGDILDDHGFALSGSCDLNAHPLFARDSLSASVLPGH
jgi:hypothetical protein